MPLSDNVLGAWHLDGNLTDASGSGNDLGVPPDSYTSGKFGQAAVGTVPTGLIGPLVAPPTGQFAYSVSLWFQLPSTGWDPTPDNSTYCIATLHFNPNNDEFFSLVWSKSSGESTLYLYTEELDFGSLTIGTITYGDWHHVVITVNVQSGYTVNAYLDGARPINDHVGDADGSTWSGDGFGFNLYTATDLTGMPGYLDEVVLWGHAKELSATEVAQLYNGGAGLAYPFSSGPLPIPTGFLSSL
jgi:hypothetical protein